MIAQGSRDEQGEKGCSAVPQFLDSQSHLHDPLRNVSLNLKSHETIASVQAS